jgi:Family of unknown function (DUF5677)
MAISDDGFLSEEAQAEAAKVVTKYKQAFLHLKDVNAKAHEFLREAEATADDPKQIFAIAFFARALCGFQALKVLSEQGFLSECRVVCRNILEVKFKLGFLEKRDDAVSLFLAEYQRHRISRMENMMAGTIPLSPKLDLPDWENLIKVAKERLLNDDGTQKKLPGIKVIAEEAGFISDYLGFYSLLSEAIHSGAAELDDYVEFNEKNQVIGFRYGPTQEPWLVWIILCAAGNLVDCIQITAQIVNATVSPIHRFLEMKHKDMIGMYHDILLAESKSS